jgi:hypothetical protein
VTTVSPPVLDFLPRLKFFRNYDKGKRNALPSRHASKAMPGILLSGLHCQATRKFLFW